MQFIISRHDMLDGVGISSGSLYAPSDARRATTAARDFNQKATGDFTVNHARLSFFANNF
jgi:hypothetical protein